MNIRLGKIICLDEPVARDAVHIAIVPLIAGETLSPGVPIRLSLADKNIAISEPTRYEGIGIVDPFISPYVRKGERFWCFIYPETITGMRHHWQHPNLDMPDRPISGESHMWLLQFADRWNMDYESMIEEATSRRPSDAGYILARGRDLNSPEQLGEDHDLFWDHLEKMTGMTFDQAHRDAVTWACTC